MEDAKNIDVVIETHNLIEYGDNCSKRCGSLWYYHRDETFINNNCIIIDVPDDPDSALFE